MSATQILHTGGRRLINQIINGSTARPANLYLILRTLDGAGGHTADAAADDSLTNHLNEVAGSGYARIAIALDAAHFPETASGADSLLTAAAQTFTFTGAVNGVTHAALATTADNSGVLIASAPLAAVRNVANGDTLTVTFKLTETQG